MEDFAHSPAALLDLEDVPTQEQLLRADLDAFRMALEDISVSGEPERWAAGHLILGLARRLRAEAAGDSGRAQLYEDVITDFERALEVYCQRKPLALEWHDGVLRGRPPSAAGIPAEDVDGVDLVLAATRSPIQADMPLLESAVRLFRGDSSWRVRETDFRLWVLNMKNYGCALTLLGRCRGGEAGIVELEEAVDAFRSVLKEPALEGLFAEQASVHVNLAETLHALAEHAMPAERLRYLESAVDALVQALGVMAPAPYRGLFNRSQ